MFVHSSSLFLLNIKFWINSSLLLALEKISHHFLLASMVFGEKFTVISKMSCHFLLPSWFLLRDPQSIKTLLLIIMCHFCLAAFNTFSFSFVFSNLIMMCLGMDVLESVGLRLSQNLGDFQQLSLQIIFFCTPFSPLHLGPQ